MTFDLCCSSQQHGYRAHNAAWRTARKAARHRLSELADDPVEAFHRPVDVASAGQNDPIHNSR
jgi:hypothetical protein